MDLPAWISPLLEKSKNLPEASGEPWHRFARASISLARSVQFKSPSIAMNGRQITTVRGRWQP